MARARTRRSKRGSRAGRISFKVSPQMRKAIKRAKTAVRRVVIVGEVQDGKAKFSTSRIKKVTARRRPPEVLFLALNAPFRTKVLTGAA